MTSQHVTEPNGHEVVRLPTSETFCFKSGDWSLRDEELSLLLSYLWRSAILSSCSFGADAKKSVFIWNKRFYSCLWIPFIVERTLFTVWAAGLWLYLMNVVGQAVSRVREGTPLSGNSSSRPSVWQAFVCSPVSQSPDFMVKCTAT